MNTNFSPVIWRIALILVFSISLAGCNGPTIPSGSNQSSIDGSEGTPSEGIPVKCNQATGNVHIPAGSFSGTETVKIECVGSNQIQELNNLVKNQTGQTNEVLGAITLEPSPFNFAKDVNIIIPLLKQRMDLANKYHDLYYLAPNVSGDLRHVPMALIAGDGWTASANVDHFSTFILVGPSTEQVEVEPEEEAVEEAPAEPAVSTRTLVGREGDEFFPDLATSWEVSEDEQTWTFKLEQDVMMSDGSIFTSYQVADAIRKQAPYFADYAAYEFPDDYTISFYLIFPQSETPDFVLLEALSQINFDVQ